MLAAGAPPLKKVHESSQTDEAQTHVFEEEL
jgi:hypothetical protein